LVLLLGHCKRSFEHTRSSRMGGKSEEKKWFSFILKPFKWLLCGRDVKTNSTPKTAEAAIVAASKHFSSAHKINFS